MTKPRLDCANGYAGFMPPGGTRLAETVQIEVFAHGSIFAGNLNLLSLFISSFGKDRSTLAAVQASPLGDALEFTEEMIVRTAFLIYEDPSVVWSVVAPGFKQRYQ